MKGAAMRRENVRRFGTVYMFSCGVNEGKTLRMPFAWGNSDRFSGSDFDGWLSFSFPSPSRVDVLDRYLNDDDGNDDDDPLAASGAVLVLHVKPPAAQNNIRRPSLDDVPSLFVGKVA